MGMLNLASDYNHLGELKPPPPHTQPPIRYTDLIGLG